MKWKFLAFAGVAPCWSPESWKQYPSLQIPEYPDVAKLEEVKSRIRASPPLVFGGEIRALRKTLSEVNDGKAFLFQAGPCAETFEGHDVHEIKRLFTVMVQSSLIMSYCLEKKVVRIGRIAGQYAKPRSEYFEKDNKTITYRGDIMHDFKDRILDPERLQTAYLNSATGLNALRSFAKSGDLDLARINEWIVPVENSRRYTDFLTRIRRTVRFLENAGGNFDAREPEFFVSHEALLLHYEEALTRRESRSGLWYNCAAHTVWLGERTRESEAHIEYLRGIDNPIGIKVGASANAEKISEILEQLNPHNEKDKIMLISRMGADKIEEALPKLLRKLQEKQHHFILLCDPCHANTRSVNGIKTRYLETMLQEIQKFFEVCRSVEVLPGGIHLEISGSPLTECIDDDGVSSGDLTKNYQTRVDPRLNNLQMIDTAFFIGGL